MNNHEDMLGKYFVQAKEQSSLLSRDEVRTLIGNTPQVPAEVNRSYSFRSVLLTLTLGMAVLVAFILLPRSKHGGTTIESSTPNVASITSAVPQASPSFRNAPQSNPILSTRKQSGRADASIPSTLLKSPSSHYRSISSKENNDNDVTTSQIEIPTISFSDIAKDVWQNNQMVSTTNPSQIGTVVIPNQVPLGYILASPQLHALPETSSAALGKITVSRLPISTPFYNDYNPMVTADGRTLYFISNREHGLGGDDFWVAHKQDRTDVNFSEPQNLGSGINTTNAEGAASFSVDGQTMYFTGCGRPDGMGDCDIYEAHLEETGWMEVRNIREINSPYWDAQPTISADGRAIYFVSNRPGSKGDADIYVAYKQVDGTWSTPTNLGKPLNTKKKEDSPFIAPGGDALYFSSAGHKGMGGLDFFVSHRKTDGTWEEPQNLGATFNTPNDERFITLPAAEDVIYYASSDGKGGLDLFMARRHITSSSVVLSGNIIDGQSGKNLRAQLLFVDGMTGEVIAGTQTNDESDDYSLVVSKGSTNHPIYVYGLSDSLGEFRAKIELSSSNTYNEYHCDLVLGSSEPNLSTHGTEWLPELPVVWNPTSDRIAINAPANEWGDLTILDAWGHHLIQTFIKSDTNPQIDMHDAPDGLYLVRFGQRLAVISIDRNRTVQTETQQVETLH